jgi:SAM-dependent methyltransferase
MSLGPALDGQRRLGLVRRNSKRARRRGGPGVKDLASARWLFGSQRGPRGRRDRGTPGACVRVIVINLVTCLYGGHARSGSLGRRGDRLQRIARTGRHNPLAASHSVFGLGTMSRDPVNPTDADAFNEFERRGWAENSSEAYDRVFGPVTCRVVDDLLDAAGVGSQTRVLDLATGPGYVAAAAAARGARVLGVDRSPQMLDRARQAYPRIDFQEGDAEELSLPDASFDAVLANFCLLHVGRPEKMVAELARVLAPQARTALTVWGPPDRARLFGIVPDALRAAGVSTPAEIPEGPNFFRFSSDEALSALFSAAGLREVAVRTIEFRHTIPDVAHLWNGMLHGVVRTRALLALQSVAARERIHTEFARLLEPYRAGDRFDIPVCVKLASARKA